MYQHVLNCSHQMKKSVTSEGTLPSWSYLLEQDITENIKIGSCSFHLLMWSDLLTKMLEKAAKESWSCQYCWLLGNILITYLSPCWIIHFDNLVNGSKKIVLSATKSQDKKGYVSIQNAHSTLLKLALTREYTIPSKTYMNWPGFSLL